LPVSIKRAGTVLALVAHRDRDDASPGVSSRLRTGIVERDDSVLDRDEEPIAEVARRSVVRAAVLVLAVQFDEAGLPVPHQLQRHEPHLGLKLPFHLFDKR
jgi:hypothetical protein